MHGNENNQARHQMAHYGYPVSGTMIVKFASSWEANITGSVRRTPLFDKTGKGLIKIVLKRRRKIPRPITRMFNPREVSMRYRQTNKPAVQEMPIKKNGTGLVQNNKSILSNRSYRSILSYASTGSVLSIGCAGSILSIGSAGSILSIGSAGSILSIFSAGSILSILCSQSILSILRHHAVGNGPR